MSATVRTSRRRIAKPAFTRADLIAEARSWIGTPWRHQAAIKGVGADCVGFVRGAAEPFVGEIPITADYTTTWQLYRAEPRMYREFAARCQEVSLDRIKPGDILLFGFGKGPAHHCGYAAPQASPGEVVTTSPSGIAPENLRIIHCYREAGAVVEQDLTEWWHRKLRHAFQVPGISESSF